MKIYVASSWRNSTQQGVVGALRGAGFEVYDFKNPRPGDKGFGWSSIDPDWKNWSAAQFIPALMEPVAVAGFESDFEAMKWADACVLVLPCGRSAHLEAGWFVGQGKPVHIVLDDPISEPELMYRMVTSIHTGLHPLIDYLVNGIPEPGVSARPRR